MATFSEYRTVGAAEEREPGYDESKSVRSVQYVYVEIEIVCGTENSFAWMNNEMME